MCVGACAACRELKDCTRRAVLMNGSSLPQEMQDCVESREKGLAMVLQIQWCVVIGSMGLMGGRLNTRSRLIGCSEMRQLKVPQRNRTVAVIMIG